MQDQERHLSKSARQVLRSLYRAHQSSSDPATMYSKVVDVQHDLRLPWERIEDAKVQLAKYRFVSFPPSDVQRDRDQQIMTITARGIEAAQRLALRKWSTLRWLMVKVITILITAAIAAVAAAWLVANHAGWFTVP